MKIPVTFYLLNFTNMLQQQLIGKVPMLSTILYLHYFYKSDGTFSNYLKLLDFKNVKIKIRKKYIYNRNYFHNSKQKGGHTVNKQSKNIKLRKN